MLADYYKKKISKQGFKKRIVKGIKIFPKNRKIKSIHMLVNNIEIFLKKRKTISINMFLNDIKIFLKMRML